MVSIRPATNADADRLLNWRNDPVTRAASLDTREVDRDGHIAWLSRVLADPFRTLLIAEEGGAPIGMVRFDREGAVAEVSINLAPDARGRHLAQPVLRAAIDGYSSDPDAPSALDAQIRDDNVASIRTFTAVGFRPLGSRHGVGRYRRQLSSDHDSGVPADAS